MNEQSHRKQESCTELQSRELEKGANLDEVTVDEHLVEVHDGRLERITKDDGQQYFRLRRSKEEASLASMYLSQNDCVLVTTDDNRSVLARVSAADVPHEEASGVALDTYHRGQLDVAPGDRVHVEPAALPLPTRRRRRLLERLKLAKFVQPTLV
ncbi:hypothetical protein [Halostagnicola sp. A-GB9-2]|uniref:hypothetical protein n=1 Tax=Halostagnicola sp. A-GB9-2 TaxID=3048066 RepID=UPI0024BF36B6|nr:hypothetical protein [Halostagnicola sp. A-GB9-2]MDJ1434238.1 hypothetical protein [Halostagnicola sp. A-GB9-2]